MYMYILNFSKIMKKKRIHTAIDVWESKEEAYISSHKDNDIQFHSWIRMTLYENQSHIYKD